MIRLRNRVYTQTNYRTNYLSPAQVRPDGSSVSSIHRASFGRSTTSQTTMETLSEESELITTDKKDERSLLKRIFKVETRQKATGLVKITLNFAYNINREALFKATAIVKQRRVETTAKVKHQNNDFPQNNNLLVIPQNNLFFTNRYGKSCISSIHLLRF